MMTPSIKLLAGILFAVGAALAAGCGGESLPDCPSDSEAQQAAGAQVVATRCASCHSPAGGPAGGADFTSAAEVKEHAEHMYEEAAEGEMPPNGALADQELEDLGVYLACLSE